MDKTLALEIGQFGQAGQAGGAAYQFDSSGTLLYDLVNPAFSLYYMR